MTVLDSYAVLAVLKDEAAAETVQRLLERDKTVRLTALGLAEVVDHLVRLVGVEEEEAVLDVAQLGLATAEPFPPGVGLRAGLLRARHYHRRDRAVSLADCVVAEVARATGERLVTSDPHLLDLCRDERIATIALPGSTGVSST